jgi:hypothetical protein
VRNEVQELLDRDAIREVIYRERRAADRANAKLRLSLFHDDAVVLQGMFNGPASEYVSWAMSDKFPPFLITQHLVGNILVELDGSSARTEAYLLAVHLSEDADGEYVELMGIRYFDRFARRASVWKILERQVVVDWKFDQRSDPDVPDFAKGTAFLRGARGVEDVTHQAGFVTGPR